MARSFSVNFLINGSENVSRAAAAAKGALASLTNAARNANAKVAAYQRQLANAQAALKQIDAYKNLQRAMNDSIKAQAQIRLANMQTVRQQQAAVKQLDAMRDAYKRLQKFQRGERASLDVDKNSVARLKAALALNEKSMGKGAADVMRAQIRAAEKNIRDREKSLNSIMRGAKSDLAAQDANVKNLSASFAAANAKAQQLQATLAQQRAALAALRTQIPSANIANAEAALRAQINQTTQALNREVDALNRRNAAAQRFSSARQKFSDAYGDLQTAWNFAKDNPLVDATNNAIEFEREMSRVKALTSMRDIRAGNFALVDKNMADLAEQAKRLGATTEFTSTEVAKAMQFYGYAGWSKENIAAAMDRTVDLATISPAHNIGRMADILSDTATAMGIKVGDTVQLANGKIVDAFQHYADSWAYATTTANLNDEDLFTAMKYNAGAMTSAGLTQGDVFAANMLVANAGLKGSMAGTAFRSGVIRLQAPAKAGAKALEEMGFNASDAQKEMAEAQAAFNQLGVTGSNFSERVRALGVAFSQMSNDEKLTNAYKIFGKNAATFWTKLVSNPESLFDFARYAEEIDTGKAVGWSSDTANVMRDNTWTQLEYVKSAFDAVMKSVGENFLGATRTGGKGLANLLTQLDQWIKANQTAVQWTGLLAAALTAVVVAGAGLAAVSAAVGVISSGLAVLSPIVSAVVAAFNVARVAIAAFGVTSAIAGALAAARSG